jgi:translation initiation factor IF-2
MAENENNEQEAKRPLTLSRPGGRLELKPVGGPTAAQVRQSFSHGRSKTVQVEVKKKLIVVPGQPARPASPAPQAAPTAAPVQARPAITLPPRQAEPTAPPPVVRRPEPVAAPVVAKAPPPPPVEVKAAEPPPTPVVVEPPKPAPPPIEAKAVEPTPPVAAAPVPAAPRFAPGPNMVAPPPPAAAPKPVAPPAVRGTLRTARTLTEEERSSRMKALQGSLRSDDQSRRQEQQDKLQRARAEMERQRQADEALKKEHEEARRRRDEDSKKKADDEAKRKADEAARKQQKTEEDSRREMAVRAGRNAAAKVEALTTSGKLKGVVAEADEEAPRRGGPGGRAGASKARPAAPVRGDIRRRGGKITVSRALSDEDGERIRSLASFRRAQERARRGAAQGEQQAKIVRDVVVPEAITVQDLAQRMAERSADVIKSLMRMGVMATLNHVIDADTAELIVAEFGHNLKRVAEADVEIGLKGEADADDVRISRPPVVTIMGHVDHGKTSLLDALRSTDVVSGEAGGITQHIGAYQVSLPSGRRITFIDTPGHQAFTAMRARGATVTDIVVLVVAADDGIKEQTIEAIRHAKAANAPMIVAINKMDKPGANPQRVRQELLQHDVVVEEMGGDVLDVEVSALAKTNLDKLEEAILLQAELLDLRANPERPAEGVIIEAKLDRGRGPVATVLVQRGTLKVGDIFVAGGEWGKVRALLDDKGAQVKFAAPGSPVEVLGLSGAPMAGDDFSVVDSESRAREVTEFRQRRKRDAAQVAGARGTLEEMFAQIAAGTTKELPVVVKSDVQGSLEAILASLKGLGNDEVSCRMLLSGVGGINESDITLARASNALVIGFNVRANPQARELAKRDGVDIRYYSIIYDVIDDVRKALEGLLSPTLRETFLGNAEIRQIFEMSKYGKVAGCMVSEGIVRRGAKVRLLRDSVVIHEGTLKTLRRFKDDVKEVREGYECGMAFENYENIQVGDVIECFDLEEVARLL